jgi:hypothetical protein
MGFNKRIISLDRIEKCINSNNSLKKLFNSDALIFEDQISSQVLDWVIEGLDDNQISLKLNQYKDENNQKQKN